MPEKAFKLHPRSTFHLMDVCFSRKRSNPVVAVPAWNVDRQGLPASDSLDRWRMGVQDVRPGRGGTEVGCPQKQAEDELREAEPQRPILLRQEHHPQDGRKEIRLQIRLWPRQAARIRPDGAVPCLWSHSPVGHRRLNSPGALIIATWCCSVGQRWNGGSADCVRSRGSGFVDLVETGRWEGRLVLL